MAIILKVSKPDNYGSPNLLLLIFIDVRGTRFNIVSCESFPESNSTDIFTLLVTNLKDSIDYCNSLRKGYVPLIQKDPLTHMHGLAVYVNPVGIYLLKVNNKQ